jgi:hypothetical protein
VKVRDLREIVDRTTRDLGEQLPDMIERAADKSPLELNTTERLVMRSGTLNRTLMRASSLEQASFCATTSDDKLGLPAASWLRRN